MSRVRSALPFLLATVLAGAASPSISRAAPALSFEPQLGVPENVRLFGASPGQASGEVWATAEIGSVPATVDGQQVPAVQQAGKKVRVLARHAQGTGWQIVPVENALGAPLEFKGPPQASPDGGIAMLSQGAPTIITRDSIGEFTQAPPPVRAPAPDSVLEADETFSDDFAAVDEPEHVGVLIVPGELSPTKPGVLHYDGAGWTREQICTGYPSETKPCAAPTGGLDVKAIAASSPQNAWLLASPASEETGEGSLMLFRRVRIPFGSGWAWVQSQPKSWAPGATVSARPTGQMLNVTSAGVWVDARLNHSADVSLWLEPPSPLAGPGEPAPPAVHGRWCYPQEECKGTGWEGGSLGAPLPSSYSSFAWPGAAGGPGSRIVAGLERGALLDFQEGGDFQYLPGGGGQASANAEFTKSGDSAPEGWIAGVSEGRFEATAERVSASPEAPALGGAQAWPLPFRRPLLAIAGEPGSRPGDPNAQALAVGDQGQIARFIPGQGWTPEFLYNGAGVVQRPRLRGVAWPEPGRAYAVGDEGAMWLWRADTGLWEPDPAAPLDFHGNLTAIAFSPLDPTVGYAVGKQGTLLAYDKTWTQQALPPGLEGVNFTSVAFAGGEALASYREVVKVKAPICPGGAKECEAEVGGLLVNGGSGWQVDQSAQQLLGELPNPTATVLSKVAGLPDGGAVAAGPGIVIERDSAGSSWRFSRQPLPEAQNISALAAFRAGQEVRALVSIDLDERSNPNALEDSGSILETDSLLPPTFGEPPGLVGPDPLPGTGYLLRETAEGWQDLEHQAYPGVPSGFNVDLPDWPDAVLALDVDPSGTQGWAVGGQTGGLLVPGNATATQTAGALRLGSGPAPPQGTGAPIPTPHGQATFAVGGDAQCENLCADLVNEGLGPDAWLSAAVSTASRISGLHAFLYTGARVAEGVGRSLGAAPGGQVGEDDFTREMQGYANDLSGAGGLPVRVAPSPSDVDPEGGLSTFAQMLGADAGAGSTQLGGTGAYAFDSGGGGGTVRVIVLDYSASELAPGELGWLAEQLDAAKGARIPALVMGSADIVDREAPNRAADGAAVEQVLLAHGASAYLFDSPNENRALRIGSGANSIPAFGTGTLGYGRPAVRPEEFLGASGFLLASVDVADRSSLTNRAPVTATLTPNIAQLGLQATDGTLLRRSQVALFQGLARRPRGGTAVLEGQETVPDPYVPLPEPCVGAGCSQFIAPAYTFTSSDEEVGEFVEPEPASLNPRAVLQGPDGKPIPDAQSGLFCAFNPGTTTVSITSGGLTYSEPVTVQAGSVEQPCGTVPTKPQPAVAVAARAPLGASPPSAPAAGSPSPVVAAPPPPVVTPATPPAASPPPHAPAPIPFFATKLPVVALVALPLLPPPPLARPIPPSGTSPVTAPAVAPKEEEEDEEAVESARNSMAAYNPENPPVPPIPMIALLVVAAATGTAIRRVGRGRRRARPTPALARARERRYERLS
ncbi:MAG TPA: hypothetical protein VKG38_00735 [Solirubrobacteraceae bacterium]|nr:hypothetical protein [Solirubrobacteraceae bacterium]